MPAVDDDDVALGVEAAAPQLAGGSLKGVAGQASGVDDSGGHCALQAIGDRDEAFRGDRDLALRHGNFEASQPGNCRSSIPHLLIRDAVQAALTVDQLPSE